MSGSVSGAIDAYRAGVRAELSDLPPGEVSEILEDVGSTLEDLRPELGESATFDDVVTVARLVKDTLDLLELDAFPKTSGSRGIHILLPVARRHTFADARDFASIIAGALARAHPGLVTTEWARKKSGRTRFFVPASATAFAPFSQNSAVWRLVFGLGQAQL